MKWPTTKASGLEVWPELFGSVPDVLGKQKNQHNCILKIYITDCGRAGGKRYLHEISVFVLITLCNVVFWLGFGVPQIKAVMTLASGIPMGPPRLPLSSASEDFVAKVKAKLESLKSSLYS